MTSSNKAWVTLATNDSYSLGALVLAHSLKNVKTAHKLAILITPGVTTPMKQQIEAVFDDVKVVDVLDSRDQTHLALMSRPELGVTFTKLHCWTLTNYEKCVFLDADTLVLQNCDELFQREELSAAPDPGWPDCFNSGVFVFKPSLDTFGQLLEFARTRGSFDGGDQGLLNMFFKEWAHADISKHLSFTYNVVWSSTYSYLPALKQFGQHMKIIHFISASKPWLQSFNTETRLVTATTGGTGLQPLLQFWWDLFCRHVHPGLSTEMIESRLSSRYSYVFHPEFSPSNNLASNYTSHSYTPNNYNPNNNTFINNFILPYEPPKEDHYKFIDPWEECMVVKEQINNEVEEAKSCYVENVKGDGNLVEVCVDKHCEQEVENNYFKNNCDTEEQTRNYSFQNNVVEECYVFGNKETKNEKFEEMSEYDKATQEHYHPISSEHYPACTDDIPINFNSNLSVNNCRPGSPTHCEVPKDQPCDFDGGLAGQFARVSLGEKTADQKALEDFLRRQSWEQGHMDYLGKDSFSNIWAKINETLGKTPEVKIETDSVKKPSPPEVVHTEEPKPLKSALKKTSTTIPPVVSELNIDSSEPPVKQLEKLDLSKNVLKQAITPDTPIVTSPTPPTTPATYSQEPVETESPVPVKELPKPDVSAEKSTSQVEQESPKQEPIDPLQVTEKSDDASVKEQNEPKSDSSVSSSVKEAPQPSEPIIPQQETPKSDNVNLKEQSSPKSVSSVLSSVKEPPQSSETPQKPQSSKDNSTPVVSNDPPVAPKRTKGSSGPKNAKSSEKK